MFIKWILYNVSIGFILCILLREYWVEYSSCVSRIWSSVAIANLYTLRRGVLCSAYEVIPFHLSVLHFLFFFCWMKRIVSRLRPDAGNKLAAREFVVAIFNWFAFDSARTSTTNFDQFSLVWPFVTSRANKLFWRQYESIFNYHSIRLTIECVLESDRNLNNWKNIQIFECHKKYNERIKYGMNGNPSNWDGDIDVATITRAKW